MLKSLANSVLFLCTLTVSIAKAGFEDTPASEIIKAGTQWNCRVESQSAHELDDRAAWRESKLRRIAEISFDFMQMPSVGDEFIVHIQYENGESLSLKAHTMLFEDAGFPKILFRSLGGIAFLYLSPLNAGVERPAYLLIDESGSVDRNLQMYCSWRTLL